MLDEQSRNMRRSTTPVVVAQSMTIGLQGGYKASAFQDALPLMTKLTICLRALHNPKVSPEAKQHAKEVLKEHDV